MYRRAYYVERGEVGFFQEAGPSFVCALMESTRLGTLVKGRKDSGPGLRRENVDGSQDGGSAPCEHVQTFGVGPGGSKGQTGTEQCTSDAVLCKPRMLTCPVPTPSPCAGDGMDASAPVLLLPPVHQLLGHMILLFLIPHSET